MRDLYKFILDNLDLNNPDCLSSLFSTFEKLTELTQPQNIRRAAFLGYSTIAKISSDKKIVKKIITNNIKN